MFVDPQFTRSEILRIFDRAQIYIVLGSAIATIGLLAAAFSVLRRRFDPLLFWFSLFAILYGARLCMNYQLLWALGLRPAAFRRIVIAIGYLVPVPAFFFFRRLHLLGGVGRLVMNIAWPAVLILAIATLAVGPYSIFRIVNNSVVIAALVILAIELVRVGRGSPDVTLIRGGLLIFIVCALFDNVTGLVGHYYNIEPFSFLVLLASLGIVAGRRALANEQQLSVIQKELDIAHHIQLSILPSAFPDSRSFRVAARYLPMNSVAGDFYDFLLADDHQAGLFIADVSGHGIPAALIASMVKLAAATRRADANDPSRLLLELNAILLGNTQSQFVTAAYVYLNASREELRYSAAAHPPMLLLRNNEVMEITENGLMLASFEFATYSTITYSIRRGDRFVLYTDGMVEALNSNAEEFGSDRLHALVRESAGLSLAEAADHILSSVQRWSATQGDDLTLLLCDYTA
ncbi:MAG: PP2C family protein-serine/threonine phosphatase [Acidobacteriaceae bacterium]|nr:PP2C family protein-serine/threonine phosphatase [Acidobacteriaceae bacterium]